MSAGIWFWIIFVIVGLFGGFFGWRTEPANRVLLGGWGLLFILIGLLGWGVFGPPIK